MDYGKMKPIISYIEGLQETLEGEDEIVRLWNEVHEAWANRDEYIYRMFEFDDLFQDNTPLQIVSEVEGRNFDTSDRWFYYERGIYLKSFSSIGDVIPLTGFVDMVSYIVKENNAFGNKEIEEILKGESA